MGKTYSVEKKEEEVIIAQNGANQATTSKLEMKLETMTIMMTVMAVIIGVALAVAAYKICRHGTGRALRKELDAFKAANLPSSQVNV